MEGAGFIRSHSEKVVLRTNIFADPDDVRGNRDENDPEADEDEGLEPEDLLADELRALAKAEARRGGQLEEQS